MKGILLAGGSGTRLHPLTMSVSKQMLPVYDKPMVYYPLSVLMLSNVRDIILISTERDLPGFQFLLGDGSKFGVNIEYALQREPEGLAQALTIAEPFLDGGCSTLVLGDNIYYGSGLPEILERSSSSVANSGGASVFSYRVSDPERYGVVEFEGKKVISIEEKPTSPKSKYALTGLYMFDAEAPSIAKEQKKSSRGEYEIVDVLNHYLDRNTLEVMPLSRGMAWLDTGTHESLLDAGNFVHALEKRQGLRIACLEEIAYNKGWINNEELRAAANQYKKSGYGQYLASIAENE